MKGQILINANPSYFISPRISQSKRSIKSPHNKDILSVGPHRLSNPYQTLLRDDTSTYEKHITSNLNSLSATHTESFKGPYHKQSMQVVEDSSSRGTPLIYGKQVPKSVRAEPADMVGTKHKRSSVVTGDSEIPTSALNTRAFEPTYQRRGHIEISINRNSGDEHEIN